MTGPSPRPDRSSAPPASSRRTTGRGSPIASTGCWARTMRGRIEKEEEERERCQRKIAKHEIALEGNVAEFNQRTQEQERLEEAVSGKPAISASHQAMLDELFAQQPPLTLDNLDTSQGAV